MKPARDVTRLVEIMQALRAPDTGCPWDIEQTFGSIVPYTIEEVYEVVDAIDRGDMENLEEELGDLLLQVVYHAQIADELKHFSFPDVVETITKKMIRRHPHVFGDETARSAGMAKGTWERIKSEEKAERTLRKRAKGIAPIRQSDSMLNDVPSAMPPMMEAVKLQAKASKVGFGWNDPRAVLSKVREELNEYEQELDSGNTKRLQEELGDILFAVTNLARHADIDPDRALKGTNAKFRNRFRYIEDNIASHACTMMDASLEQLESLWSEAKTAENQ